MNNNRRIFLQMAKEYSDRYELLKKNYNQLAISVQLDAIDAPKRKNYVMIPCDAWDWMILASRVYLLSVLIEDMIKEDKKDLFFGNYSYALALKDVRQLKAKTTPRIIKRLYESMQSNYKRDEYMGYKVAVIHIDEYKAALLAALAILSQIELGLPPIIMS